MTALEKNRRLLVTFAHLADTLVGGYDIVDLMQQLVDTCRDELGVSAAGLLLADARGDLELIASTSENGDLVEAMQLGAAGPGLTSYSSGSLVAVSDIDRLGEGWEEFRRTALAQGFTSIIAIPLRLREHTIGTLNLLQKDGARMPDEDIAVARALADVATIGVLHERSMRETEALSTQLQHALNSRVVIEQAKGVISHTRGVSIDDAFAVLRHYARSHGERLGEVARRIVERQLTID